MAATRSSRCTTSPPTSAPRRAELGSYRWQSLRNGGTELAVCIASGIKRGVVNKTEQERYDLPSDTLSKTFELVGLGQLIGAVATADRYVEFPA